MIAKITPKSLNMNSQNNTKEPKHDNQNNTKEPKHDSQNNTKEPKHDSQNHTKEPKYDSQNNTKDPKHDSQNFISCLLVKRGRSLSFLTIFTFAVPELLDLIKC